MLQHIRDNAHGWWTYLLVPVLILLFALWGIGNYLGGSFSQTEVAKVNGEAVSVSMFSNVYRAMQSDNPNAPTKALKLQAVETLVSRTILAQGLSELGLTISDASVDQMIYQVPAFQQNGQFSMQRYKAVLQNMGETTQALRVDMRQGFLVTQFQNALASSQFVLPAERLTATHYANLLRDVAIVTIPLSHFAKQHTPSAAAIQAYYHAHQDEFMAPLHVKLAYVMITKSQFAKKGRGNADASYSAALNKASNLAFQNPGSLQPIAAAMKVGVKTTPMLNTQNPKGLLAHKAVLEAVQSSSVLQQGNNSSVLQISPDKAVIIHVVNSKPAEPLPLAKVKKSVIAQMQKEQAAKTAQAALQSMVSAINQGGNITTVTQAYGFKPHTVRQVNARTKSLPTAIVKRVVNLGVNQAALIQLPHDKVALVQVTKAYSNAKKADHPVSAKMLSGLWVQVELEQYLSQLQQAAKVRINQAVLKN